MERVASGVFAIVHDDAILSFPDGAASWPHGNVGVVIGNDGALVIDSDFLPSRAAADIALIRQVTRKPVRYLVNTHWHGDHTHGNSVFADSFPGMSILGARDNAQFIGVNQARYPLSVLAPGSSTRALLAHHDSILARGTDTDGLPLSAASRALLVRVITQEKNQLREFALIRPAPPTVLFDGAMTVDLGGRRVELVNRGHANSPDDVTIYVPDARVLFTGDIVVWPVPYTFDSYPRPWARVLRDLEAAPADVIVPGHGPVFHDAAYVRQVRELLETALAKGDSLVRLGKLRPELEKSIDLSSFKPAFARPGDPNGEAYWQAAIQNSLIERVYQCLVGSRC